MDKALIPSLMTSAFVLSITPGPNNVMLLASGVNFGLRPTMPHTYGIAAGFAAIAMLAGVGMAGVFSALPWLYDVLHVAGTLYLLFLAFKIAAADGIGSGAQTGRPMTFYQGFIFQWVNPKAWSMVFFTMTTFAPADADIADIAVITSLFVVAGYPCLVIWVAFGKALRPWLTRKNILRTFNIAMALLLVASLYPLLKDFV